MCPKKHTKRYKLKKLKDRSKAVFYFKKIFKTIDLASLLQDYNTRRGVEQWAVDGAKKKSHTLLCG